jgi:hypothetical protein
MNSPGVLGTGPAQGFAGTVSGMDDSILPAVVAGGRCKLAVTPLANPKIRDPGDPGEFATGFLAPLAWLGRSKMWRTAVANGFALVNEPSFQDGSFAAPATPCLPFTRATDGPRILDVSPDLSAAIAAIVRLKPLPFAEAADGHAAENPGRFGHGPGAALASAICHRQAGHRDACGAERRISARAVRYRIPPLSRRRSREKNCLGCRFVPLG